MLIALFVLVFSFGRAWHGMCVWLRRRLPGDHFGADSGDTVKVTIGWVGAMTALRIAALTPNNDLHRALQRARWRWSSACSISAGWRCRRASQRCPRQFW